MKKRHFKKFKGSLPKKKTIFKKKKERKESSSQQRLEFPSISRIIPDFSLDSLKGTFLNKYFLVSFVSTFIGVAILMQGIDLAKHISELQMIRSEREQVRREIAYWENIIKTHQDYRDGYFKLALLEYRIGNRDKAKMYIEKTLIIDPNYTQALKFQEKVKQ